MESIKKKYVSLIFFPVILLMIVGGCGSSTDSGPTIEFDVELSAEQAGGENQYEYDAESSDTVSIDVSVQSPAPLQELLITKTKNGELDTSYGTDGEKVIDASGTNFNHEFVYIPDTTDLDPLVGFAFEATNEEGETAASDLTLNVNLSPRDNITRVRWDLSTLIHVNEGGEDITEDCHEGYALLLNADSTMSRPYGEQACGLDELNEYDKWYFTNNDETIIMERHSVFTPDQTVVDTFDVLTLTLDELDLEQTIDLTEVGDSIETYRYEYDASPRE